MFAEQLTSLLWSVSDYFLITLETYGIFGSTFAYVFILVMSSHPGMQNGGDSLTSSILVGQGLFVKMLIAFEPHGII